MAAAIPAFLAASTAQTPSTAPNATTTSSSAVLTPAAFPALQDVEPAAQQRSALSAIPITSKPHHPGLLLAPPARQDHIGFQITLVPLATPSAPPAKTYPPSAHHVLRVLIFFLRRVSVDQTPVQQISTSTSRAIVVSLVTRNAMAVGIMYQQIQSARSVT